MDQNIIGLKNSKTKMVIKNNNTSSSKQDEYNDLKKSAATRKDLHLGRRLFHASGGIIVATTYNLLLTHQQIIYILGTCACVFYLFEQIRIAYPEYAEKFNLVTKYLLRAEEQLKESAAIPYSIAMLLTILTFPKMVALVAIYTLAIADPLSAIVGIRFGKHHVVENKTIEGSVAFFLACFLCVLLILLSSVEGMTGRIWIVSFIVAFLSASFEMLPIRIDDNLTIPLFTATILWIICGLFGIHVYNNFMLYFSI